MDHAADYDLYICGPSCAGKSTLAKHLLGSLPPATAILGDDFWVQHAALSFQDRLTATNQQILKALAGAPDLPALIEWVPWHRPFVSELHHITTSRGRRFVQVTLTADRRILQDRKLARDGNTDLGPVIPSSARGVGTLWFDTGTTPMLEIVTQVRAYLT